MSGLRYIFCIDVLPIKLISGKSSRRRPHSWWVSHAPTPPRGNIDQREVGPNVDNCTQAIVNDEFGAVVQCLCLFGYRDGKKGSMVAQWLALLPGFESRPFCVELACSPRVCVGFLRVLRFPPTSKDMHSILLSLRRDQGTGIRTGVGPRALHCGCPLFLTSLGWVKCRGQISPPGLIKYDVNHSSLLGQVSPKQCWLIRPAFIAGLGGMK